MNRLLGLAGSVLLILTGCAHGEHTDIDPIPVAIPNLTATLSHPAVVKALVNVPLALKLTDSTTGRPVVVKAAEIDLTMPSMSMPPNTIRLHPTGLGIYSGTGTFTMPGKWLVDATIFDAKGRYDEKSFPVVVK